MTYRIGQFNAENLFNRYKYLGKDTGDSNKKRVDPSEFLTAGGTINDFAIDILDEGRRVNTARVITSNDPDIIGLEEVENIDTLKKFNSGYLKRKYPYSMLIGGCDDLRHINVGILSKYPIRATTTHQFDKDKKGVIFSRDCLEADVILDQKGEKKLTLFVNHHKSQLKANKNDDTDAKRERQSKRVAEIIEERFGDDAEAAHFIVLGDLNDTPDAECLKPLVGMACLENVVARMPAEGQWTYFYKGKVHQYDYILLSKALAEKNPDAVPIIERRGLGDYVKAYGEKRFKGVAGNGTEASDHCGVFIDIDV